MSYVCPSRNGEFYANDLQDEGLWRYRKGERKNVCVGKANKMRGIHLGVKKYVNRNSTSLLSSSTRSPMAAAGSDSLGKKA